MRRVGQSISPAGSRLWASWSRVLWHSLNRGPATDWDPWFVAHFRGRPDRAGRERARGDGGRGGGPGQVPRGRLRAAARDTRRLRVIRGPAGRPGHRRRLQPAAELAARAVDAAGDRRREARAVREAVRVQRGRGGAGRGRRRGLGPGRDGGHALPLPPADAAAERARRRTGAGAAPAVLDELRHRGPGRHQVRLRPGRRRADGRRLLRDRLPAAARRQRGAGVQPR